MQIKDLSAAFFVFGILIVLLSMHYLNLQSNDAAQKELAIAAIYQTASNTFLLFVLSGIIAVILISLDKSAKKNVLDFLSKGSSFEIAAGLGIFFVAWTVWLSITSLGGTQSIFELPAQSIFSSAGEALNSKFWQIVVVGISAPIAEEIFFLALAGMIFYITDKLTKELNNKIPQTLIVIISVGLTALIFANFHVGQQANQQFLLYSIMFRVITLGLIYLDQLQNIIPFLNVGVGATWGIHLANNLRIITNPIEFVGIMFAGDGTFLGALIGLLILAFFTFAFIAGIQKITLSRKGVPA